MDQQSLEQWRRPFLWDELVQKKLKEVFGKKQFMPLQLESINMVLSQKDVFIFQPTGYGKSMIYQLSALVSRGVTFVISPLISLIQDQVSSLRCLGVEVDSTVETAMDSIVYKINNGLISILYTTAEKLTSDKNFFSNVKVWASEGRVARFIIDEAHCVSKWGFDFRPAYNHLSILKTTFKDIPIVALSATVTQQVMGDVMSVLQIPNCIFVRGSMNRTNLSYEVAERGAHDGIDQLFQFIHSNFEGASGIVYCLRKADCETVASKLNQLGVSSGYYHSDLSNSERQTLHLKWVVDDIQVIVATVSFGMGIDKADVRFVVHYQMPQCLESYLQESGRAGRDGNNSKCLLMYNRSDYNTNAIIMSSGRSGDEQNERLAKIQQYCLNQTDCRRKILLEYLGEEFNPIDCQQTCDNCRNIVDNAALEKYDLSEQSKILIQNLGGLNLTYNQLVQLLKGDYINSKSIALKQLWLQSPLNKLFQHHKSLVERFLQEMILKEYLTKRTKNIEYQQYKTSYQVVEVNPKALYNYQDLKIEINAPRTLTPPIYTQLTQKILKDRSNENFQRYLKKGVKSASNTSESYTGIMKITRPINIQKVLNSLINPDQIEFKLANLGKRFLFNDVFGYCSELQYLTLEERIRDLRKDLFKQEAAKNNGLVNIENIISNQSISELVWKLPLSIDELHQEDVVIPYQIKDKPYMPQVIAQIKEFIEVEKIEKSEYYYLQVGDLKTEVEMMIQQVVPQVPQVPQVEKVQQKQQYISSNIQAMQAKLKNKKQIQFL